MGLKTLKNRMLELERQHIAARQQAQCGSLGSNTLTGPHAQRESLLREDHTIEALRKDLEALQEQDHVCLILFPSMVRFLPEPIPTHGISPNQMSSVW